MLDIRLSIAQVDHKSCVEVLLPMLVEHCASKSAPGELDAFLASLGSDAVPAASALLEEMNIDERDALVVWLVAAHEQRLRNAANRELSGFFGGQVINIGRFFAEDLPGSRLSLMASQVSVDYTSLLNSPAVTEGVEQIASENAVLKSAAKLAISLGRHLPADSLEKQGIRLLGSASVQQRLIAVLQQAVRQEGVAVTLEGMSVSQSDVAHSGAIAASSDGSEYERKLFKALGDKAEKLRRERA